MKRTLRDICIAEYGEEFGEKYDQLNRGMAIGNLEQTVEFLDKVEAVRYKYEDELKPSLWKRIFGRFIR